MTLGEKIIEFRKKCNLTQEKLSNKIGVSRQTLSNWESNITSPDINQAKTIAEIFKVSLDDLTNNKVELECSNNKSILMNLLEKECYLDIDIDDYRLNFNTLCKVIEVNNDFIKIEFKYGKKIITKLIDINLILSIRCIVKDEEEK